MKILFLAAADSLHTIRWVNALAGRGHKVYLVYLKNHRNVLEKMNSDIVLAELPFQGTKGYYLNGIYLRKLTDRIQPDIVNAHYASGYGTLMRIAGLKHTVLSVWGSDVYKFPYKNKVCMKVIEKNLLYAEVVASTSNCMAEQINKLLKIKRDIKITPFGVDLKVFLNNEKREHSEQEIVIGNIKSLKEIYGIRYLIQGIKKLIKLLNEKGEYMLASKIKCHIYGDGEQKLELQEMIKEFNLENVVKLKGSIPHNEVVEALRNIDIFCATSIQESFGVSVIEAEAMEIPVVVSNAPGFCEVVEDGVTGIVVKKRSVTETAKALEKLVLDKQLRKEMGHNGRIRVEKLYNWEQNVSKMEEIYMELMEGLHK